MKGSNYKYRVLLIGLLFNVVTTIAQDNKKPAEEKEPIDVDFLFGYYEQEGVHSAVTGGEGTESLQDRDLKVIVNIPTDSARTLLIDFDINYYTSASTDRIDNNVSSASARDLRAQIYLGYTKQRYNKNDEFHYGVSGSLESDYYSSGINFLYTRYLRQQNDALSVGLRAYFDRWIMIFPVELRRPETVAPSTDRRRSFDLSGSYAWVINKRMQAMISGNVVLQRGLLSTPFHRVYERGISIAKLERLPDERWKFPIAIRYHVFLGDNYVVKTFARYYHDSFGIDAFTISAEPSAKLSDVFTLFPFYRFHSQSAADHFRPRGEHDPLSRFATSDFDLSAFTSNNYGLGIRWAPLPKPNTDAVVGGRRKSQFEDLSLRFSRYKRSDGLSSFLFSIGVGLKMK